MAMLENATDSSWHSKAACDYVNDWFLMDTPVLILVIWLAYMAFVLKLGPAYMEKRPAFQLRTVLIVYNLLQVLYSTYLFQAGVRILSIYGLVSSQCVLDNKVSEIVITEVTYLYLTAKISELLDTVFFVLRKKQNQVTFLHVYHHSLMVLSTWAALKYNPSFSVIFLGTINSFIHIIMYSYYGLSAFPNLEKYLWWKKYITSIQLIQFGLICIHVSYETYISECRPSYILLLDIFINLVLIVYLFLDFYIKSYVSNDAVGKSKKLDVPNAEETKDVTPKIKNTSRISHQTTKIESSL